MKYEMKLYKGYMLKKLTMVIALDKAVLVSSVNINKKNLLKEIGNSVYLCLCLSLSLSYTHTILL